LNVGGILLVGIIDWVKVDDGRDRLVYNMDGKFEEVSIKVGRLVIIGLEGLE